MSAIFLEIHPENPESRKIKQAVQIIKDGGLVIYPTDTLYGLGCDITNNKAVERVCRIKGIKPQKANFSFICSDLSNIAFYTKPFSNSIYKSMRKNLPGPFTFILKASNQVPKMLKNNRKNVGIRVPNSPIVSQLLEGLENPIISTSIKNIDDDITPYPTDPYTIYEEYKHLVDLVIDGGFGGNVPSTVIDCTNNQPEIIRLGLGDLQY
ncbi:L-threonylcarbamoyladenylate synthase [Aureispira anguillae]|uniref:L-threonylcarbamoyladenylate synthase n=1 Tax=Aureispira anguillae TaxID=2864201 RepID=A0A916DTC0_9BACT|nr:L-threonylcarbamoyladenylate synthase [Aureispira anguillae]BDS12456.1 L-threonylcarbamoyladenylate synthase [Aureispira anguillae]